MPVEPELQTDLLAPLSADCATVCHQELTAFDQNNGTELVRDFQLSVLRQLQLEGFGCCAEGRGLLRCPFRYLSRWQGESGADCCRPCWG